MTELITEIDTFLILFMLKQNFEMKTSDYSKSFRITQVFHITALLKLFFHFSVKVFLYLVSQAVFYFIIRVFTWKT